MVTTEQMRLHAALSLHEAIIACAPELKLLSTTQTCLDAVDALGDYFLALATKHLPKAKPDPNAATLAPVAPDNPDAPRDCGPHDHIPVFETPNHVYCKKCQRSGTLVNNDIRWSD